VTSPESIVPDTLKSALKFAVNLSSGMRQFIGACTQVVNRRTPQQIRFTLRPPESPRCQTKSTKEKNMSRKANEVWRALMVGLSLFAATVAVAQTYSSATKVGKVKGLSEIGCKGGFTDAKGACWKCPDGFKHDNIFLPPTDGKVCKDEGGRDSREGDKHKKATGIGTDCPKGQWWSSHDGYCYSCPSGYNHDIAKFGNVKGVCWKDKSDKYSAADRMKGNVLCDQNAYPDPIDGGTCWTCPANAPTRNLTARIDSAKACVSAVCGKDGERPCLLTERIPSCNAGLVEDIINNKCVTEPVAFQFCKAQVETLKAGKVPPALQPIASQVTQKTNAVTPVELKALKEKALNFVEANKSAVPEIKRLYELMQSQKGRVDELFDANVICSPSKLKQMLLGPAKALVTPNYSGKFFLAQSLSASGGYYVGAQGGLTLAIGFGTISGVPTIKEVGVFGWVGPQLITNAAVGIARGIQFYPVTELSGFEGWGWGMAASVGIPTLKVVSGGVDIAFGTTLLPVGFGASIGVGAGLLPADASIAATHSWPLWTTRDLTADVIKFSSGVVAK
jgi:hypothetical protein